MSRYKFVEQKRQEKAQTKIHPIWRGVGFVMMVLIPIISYAAAEVLIAQNTKSNFLPWPYDLMAKPGELLYNGDQMLYLKIIGTIIFMLVFYGIFTLITFAVNSIFGVSRYGPYDVPPINAKVRKKAR
jgi:hypothetical protein